MSDYLNEKVKEQASEIIELRKMLLKKDEELDARTDEVSELRRQLEERDKLIEQMFTNNLCATCSHRLVNQVEEMDTGWQAIRLGRGEREEGKCLCFQSPAPLTPPPKENDGGVFLFFVFAVVL